MLLNKVLINNANPKEKKRKHLNYISFLKFISMIVIISWHIFPFKSKPIDLGIRMCEFLFISSGFLVGYNHYEISMPPTFQQSFNYAYKSFRLFYPLILINIIFNISLNNRFKIKNMNITEIELLLANIFMVKSWGPVFVAFSFNGLSWFLCCLLFCYFMTPLLLCGIQTLRGSIILFLLFALIRISLEEFIIKGGYNILNCQFHVGPVIRCIEYYLGMLLIPLFFIIKYYLDKFNKKILFIILFTIFQIVLPISFYFFMLKYDKIIYRCYFVLIYCLLIPIISFDYGYLSYLFSLKYFKKIMSYQLEMYLFQLNVNDLIIKIMIFKKWKFPPRVLFFFIRLLIIFLFALIYKNLFKEPFAKILDKIINLIKKLLCEGKKKDSYIFDSELILIKNNLY